MKMSPKFLPILLIFLFLTGACGSASPQGAGTAQDPQSGGPVIELTDELLDNLEYRSIFSQAGVARLENGSYSEPAASDSESQTTIIRTDLSARGQVSDVDNAAAVILLSNPGGSGAFYELALVIQKSGPPNNIGSYLLGDRVRINSVEIEDGMIRVDMFTQGPQDPMCCPNQHVVNTYSLNVNELIFVRSEVIASNTATVPLELTGTTWQWTTLVETDPVGESSIPEQGRYTVVFQPNETFSYQAGCVQGSGTYGTEGELIYFDFGERPNPECEGDAYARPFLQYLVSAITFNLDADQLTLVLDANEGHLVLTPGEAVEIIPTITVAAPLPGSPVDPSQLLWVSGSASGLYEASLAVRVVDEAGNLLAEEPFLLQGENVGIGAEGTWSVSLSLEGVGSPAGQIVAYATGPQDDTWIAQTTVGIQFVNP